MPCLSPVPEKKSKSAQATNVASNFSPEPNNSSFSGLGQALSFEDGHIRVACRVRPPSAREAAFKITNDEASRAAQAKAMSGDEAIEIVAASGRCLTVLEDHTTVVMNSKPTSKIFTFDYAIHETATQEEIFTTIGKPISNACLEGYNSTMLAYGQTGSGKSFTMFGPESGLSGDARDRNMWGIVPRSIDYLFAQIARESRRSNGQTKFTCKSSFFEIFNERVFDLLDAANTDGTHSSKDRQSSDRNSRGSRNSNSMSPEDISGLQVREDQSRGVYVDGLNEAEVTCTADAIKVLEKGNRNRRVAETAMNRESSRSHAVYQLQVKSVDQSNPTGKRKSSLFTLVDLAGSERQSGTSAAGDRLKEANAINKSLSSLGQVINALVDRGQGKTRHVPYRDSKLTFLLRDSLGGNSRTFLIATVSPCDEQFGESLSTLKFSQRAKMITNSAVVNEDIVGNAETLRLEVSRLKQELAKAKLKNSHHISTNSDVSPSNEVALSGTPLAPAEVDEVLSLSLQRFAVIHKQSERYLEKTKSLRILNEKSMNQLQIANLTIKILRSNLGNKELKGIDEEEAKVITTLESEMLKMNEANKWMIACDEMRREIKALSGKEESLPSMTNLSAIVQDGPGKAFLDELRLNRQARDKSLGLSNGKDAASRPWTEECETQFQLKLQEKLNKAVEEKEALMVQLQAIMEQKSQMASGSVISPNSGEDVKTIIESQFGADSSNDSFNLFDDLPLSSRRVSTATSRRSSVGRLGRLSVGGGDVSQWSSNLESNKKIREAESKTDALSKQLHDKSLELAEANKLNSILQREKAEIIAGVKPLNGTEPNTSNMVSNEAIQKLESSLQTSELEIISLREEIDRLEKSRFEDQVSAEAAEESLRQLAQAEMEEVNRQKEIASKFKDDATLEAAQAEAATNEAAKMKKLAEEAKESEEIAQAKIKDLEDEIETLNEQVEYSKSCSSEKTKEIEALKEQAVVSARELEASKRQIESQKEAFAAMKEQLMASSQADTEGCLAELNQQLSSQAEKLAASIEQQEASQLELTSMTDILAKSEATISDLEQQLVIANETSESEKEVNSELRNEVWSLREEVSTLQSAESNLRSELTSIKDDREEVVASLEEAERVAEEARETLEIEKAQYLEELERQSEDIAALEEALSDEQNMLMATTNEHKTTIEAIEAAWNSKIDLIKAQESAALARAEQAEAEVGVLKNDTQRDVQESERELLATQQSLKREQEAHKNMQNQFALQAAKLEEQISTATELALQVKQLGGEREGLVGRMIQNDLAIKESQREAKLLQEVVIEKGNLNVELSEKLEKVESILEEKELARIKAEENAKIALANSVQSKLMEQEAYDKTVELNLEKESLQRSLESTSEKLTKSLEELSIHSGHMNQKQKIQYCQNLRDDVNSLTTKNRELTELYIKAQAQIKSYETSNNLPPSSSSKRTKTPGKTPSKSPLKTPTFIPPLSEKDSNIES